MSQIPYEDEANQVSLLDLLHAIVANWRLLVIGSIAVGVVALGVSFTLPPVYTATARFLAPQQPTSAAAMLQSLGSLGGLAGAAAGLKSPSDQFVSLLKSRSVRDSLVSRFKLKERYGGNYVEDVLVSLDEKIKIVSGKDGLIVIDVDDSDPVFAADLANAHVEELSRLLGRLAVTEAQQRRLFFEKQLLLAKGNLNSAELALKATGVSVSALKSNPAAAVAIVAQLQAQITAQEVRLASMRRYMTDSAPAIRQALSELAALRAEESKAGRSRAQVSEDDADYVARYRDVKYNETLFELFAKQFELAKIDESREGAVIQVVDRAQPPERKSKPKKGAIGVVASLVGLLVLLVFVIIRQSLRTQAQDPVFAAKLQRLRAAIRR